MTVSHAANVLGLSRRQVHRLLGTFRSEGPAAIRRKARGRRSDDRIDPAVRDFAITLVPESCADLGPTLAAETLAGRHDPRVSRETLRKWMHEDGLRLSRRQRRTVHQPRLRREASGEPIRIDGSDRRWFEDRAPACTLLVFVGDAASRSMHLEFVTSESTFGCFGALEACLCKHGRPVAFYSDKHAVFRVPNQGAKTGRGTTQFGRALGELNVEILCANPSQAKGRALRANRTLQDRPVKELRLAGVCDMEAGDAFLPGFVERRNARFAKAPHRSDDLHRALNVEPGRLRDILCCRDERQVGNQLAFSCEPHRVILAKSEITRALPGKHVDTYAFADRRFDVRWKGMSPPCSVLDKDQQGTHAAIHGLREAGLDRLMSSELRRVMT
jgi:transposase